MPLEARVLTGLALALAVVYWTTPLAIRVADRFGFHDKPLGYKNHAMPTPYLGGAAVVTGFVAAVLLLAADWQRTLPLVGGVALLWLVGTVDDRRTVAWWLRVGIEVALAAALWAAGLGWDLGYGAGVDVALTAVWVVAVVNAFNLFDNMDGQASAMGLVTAAGLAVLGVATGDQWLAVAGAALAGACFGFLPHNLLSQPARIFLGDGGSMPLGLAVAVLAMTGATGAQPAVQQLMLGLLLVGIPAVDTALVLYSRRRRGLSFLTAGRDHLTHRARQRLRTAFAVAVALGSAQIVLSLMAVAAARGSTALLGGLAVLYLVGLAMAVAVIDAKLPADRPPLQDPVRIPAPGRVRRIPPEGPVLVVLGVVAGASPLLGGYYDSAIWAPAGLGLIALLLAVGIARRPRPGAPAALALAAVAGLGAWALTSALWADSVQQAVVEANRTFVLAAVLGIAVLLIRDARTALWALGAFAGTALVVTAVTVARLLGPGAADLFLGGRLNEPLGYINAQATFAILLLWPLLAVAEQRRSAAGAGAGLAAAVVCGGLTLLSQSRGAALAVLGSVLVVLALCPGRLRRGLALALGGAAVLAAAPRLLDVYGSAPGGTVDAAAVHDAVARLLVLAAIAGAAWGALVGLERRLPEEPRRVARALACAGLAVAAGIAAVAGVASADRVGAAIERQYDAFVHLGVAEGGEQTASRLLTGAGNRYDYWTIAVGAWRGDELLGVGAGGYDQPYFLQRRTTEDIRQPHSMVLQNLAELGLPGLLLTLALFGAVAWGTVRQRAQARASRLERGLLVAAAGTFGAWAVHTQVDWIHLLPGITAAALLAAAVLLRPRVRGVTIELPGAARPVRRALVAAVVVLPVAAAGVSLSRQALAEHHRGEAQEAIAAEDPARALEQADRALRLDPEDLGSHYARAAALARAGDARGAHAVLEQAARREPGDFLTYALMGDLTVRRGAFAQAATYYREALSRNPREPALRALAEDPRSALE